MLPIETSQVLYLQERPKPNWVALFLVLLNKGSLLAQPANIKPESKCFNDKRTGLPIKAVNYYCNKGCRKGPRNAPERPARFFCDFSKKIWGYFFKCCTLVSITLAKAENLTWCGAAQKYQMTRFRTIKNPFPHCHRIRTLDHQPIALPSSAQPFIEPVPLF